MAACFKLPSLAKRPKPKTQFPEFEWSEVTVEKELGSGTFGSVYLVKYEKEHRRNVIVKKMKGESAEARRRFEKEAAILKTVKGHRNVTEFLRFCREPYAIMMEQQQQANGQPPTPKRPKPLPGILVFARLSFLDSKVTRCYGCGDTLKPGGTNPPPPDDLVLTTRLRRQYLKKGRQHTSPDISSVYYHVNPYCIRVTFPAFQPNSCRIPSDLQPFLLPEHKQVIFERLAAMV